MVVLLVAAALPVPPVQVGQRRVGAHRRQVGGPREGWVVERGSVGGSGGRWAAGEDGRGQHQGHGPQHLAGSRPGLERGGG